MAESSAVPMIVLTRHQDNVEAINSNLRNAGMAVRCNWIKELTDLGEALQQINAHMLVAFVGPDPADMTKVMTVAKQYGADVPVLFARDQVDEEIISNAMQQGARDVVTLMNPNRLRGVVARELEANRQARALNTTISSAREYRDQLKSFMAGSADAIAHVQEGIIVDANPAWLDLYGFKDADALVGTPLMDAFDAEVHAALKGALVACLQGKWSNHTLKANALLNDGSNVPLEIELSRTEFDGEPAVRLCFAARKRESGNLNEQLTEALERDASTGALQRKFFIEHLKKTLAHPIKAGVRELVAIQPDKLDAIADDIGPLVVEDFIAQFAGLVSETRQASDLVGRFGDGTLVLLMERGTARDIEVWATNLIRKVGTQVFRLGEKQISCTCSVGVGLIDARSPNASNAIADALSARRAAETAGGARVNIVDHREEDTKREAADEVWVKRIRAALMENRFRLMQQPIASLLGEDKGMFDVLVRMVDEQGEELLPAEFMAAAERNDLMKNIDRWVIGASMTFIASRPVKQLFVRLSKDSVRDKSLLQWLLNQLKSSRIEPGRLAFQISEQIATEYLGDTSELANGLRKIGFRFAIEHFGTGRDPQRLIAHLPIDYLKVDGTLMQGLAVDQALQGRVRDLVDQAKGRNIGTIAERVEDANTMAVLWQLGIEFIQGYFVNEPEQVVMG
ncbi:EAL domain-containing protein [Steroidobacter agaridevorans]|uniref:EAL domain-containing protein n=1 Tax=Steroidobacter agaridevorans TaxID=2695856 RepID=UPI00132BF550|nr:EAL domain-containing protein [Steroidobacter agaridevorans]GFE90742.1 protein FimX [Steroidobacter agaridevorans]